jgi:hypothetical protein
VSERRATKNIAEITLAVIAVRQPTITLQSGKARPAPQAPGSAIQPSFLSRRYERNHYAKPLWREYGLSF